MNREGAYMERRLHHKAAQKTGKAQTVAVNKERFKNSEGWVKFEADGPYGANMSRHVY